MTPEERTAFFEDIINTLGTTDIWTAVGYILPDGSLVDFSNTEIYSDEATSVYTHHDVKALFGYSREDVLQNGGIRIGYSDTTDHPYAELLISSYDITSAQWARLDELLNTSPNTLDLQVLKDFTKSIPFYKRYTMENTHIDMQSDISRYIDGDLSNAMTFNEKLGIPDNLINEDNING